MPVIRSRAGAAPPEVAPPKQTLSTCLAGGLIAVALIASIWIATWQRERFEYSKAQQAIDRTASNLVLAYEEHADGVLDDVDRTLRLVETEYRHGGEEFGALDKWPPDPALVKGIAVARTGGGAVFTSGELRAADPRIREEIAHHRDNPDPGPHFGRAFRDPSGEWRMLASRRISDRHGHFEGVVAASIDPTCFTDFYRRIDIGIEGVVGLVSLEHVALVRQAGGASRFGVDMRRSTVMARQAEAPEGSFVGLGNLDDIPRHYSYRTLRRYPFVVLLGISDAEAMAPTVERRNIYRLIAALASAVVLLVTVAALRSLRRQKLHTARLATAESQLRKSEACCRAITDNMAGGIITSDRDGTILSVNPAVVTMFGYDPVEMIGRPIAMLTHPSEHARLAQLFAEINGRPGPFAEQGREFRSRRKDGGVFESEVLVSGFDTDEGRIYIGIVHDISQRKRIERDLRASEAQLRASFDQTLVGIAHAGLDGRFFRANEAFCRMLRYSEQELLDRGYIDVTHPEDVDSTREQVAQMLKGSWDGRRQFTKRFVRRDGTTLWALMSFSLIHREDGVPDHFSAMVQDITEIKRAERVKSEFVSTVSHELRTPLTSINGSLGLLAGGAAGALPPAAAELVKIAARNCTRLIRLVNDILDTEKLESGKMRFELRVADLRALMKHVVEANEGFARQMGVALALDRPEEAVAAEVDPDRFEQVLTNLISNAVKFSPRGGTVELSLERDHAHAHIAVRDHGLGIPVDFQPQVFQRFSQADSSDTRQKGGTGLGLHIARAIVERLGGSVGFETTPGAGTTFHVRVPLADEARRQPPIKDREPEEVSP